LTAGEQRRPFVEKVLNRCRLTDGGGGRIDSLRSRRSMPHSADVRPTRRRQDADGFSTQGLGNRSPGIKSLCIVQTVQIDSPAAAY